MNTLLLFDIDGTLILNSSAGLTAFVRAINSLFGVNLTMDDIDLPCGKTDFLIVRELLDRAGLKEESEEDPRLIALYLRCLKEALQKDPGRVAKGARELLVSLAKKEDIYLALGTGNLAEGARIKLAYHQLDHFFATGGFSEDGNTRDELIARGRAKAEELFQTTFDRVIVIGDTPRDVACAQANDFRSIAVATGSFTAEDLTDARADYVLHNLENTQEVISIIGGLP